MHVHKQFASIRFITMFIMATPCQSPGLSIDITYDLHLLKYKSQFNYNSYKFY
jgi:hypothetical protein